MAELQDVIKYVQAIVKQIPGLEAAPDYPPEQLEPFPYVVTFAKTGDWTWGAGGTKKGLHTIKVELHIARTDLPHDVQAAMIYSDSIPNKIMKDPTLGGNVSTFRNIRYEFGPIGWNGIPTIGFMFFIEDVKMESEIP